MAKAPNDHPIFKKHDVVFQFNKAVDTGPLPNTDPATRQTIQNERIRRQMVSQIKPSPKGR